MTTSPRPIRGVLALSVIVASVLWGRQPAWAAEPVLVMDGRGWGHGVGMSQEGARTMGAQGASTDDILAKFYPGTEKGSAQATLRVLVLESEQRWETLAFPEGGEIRATASGRQPPGFPVVVAPGGSVEVLRDGTGYRVVGPGAGEAAAAGPAALLRLIRAVGAPSSLAQSTLPTSTTSPAPSSTTTPKALATVTTSTYTPHASTSSTTTALLAPPAAPAPPAPTAPPSHAAPAAPGPLWAVPRADATTAVASRGRRYRGAVEVASDANGRIRLINHVDVESYLRGMGEVLDPTWPPAALRAQAIAARTYALRAVDGGGELCDDDRCQVYLGQGAEYPAMDRAVADSRGQVLRFGGQLAATFYSANGGGVTATPEEGFGSDGTSYPYLPSAPYPSADPYPWTERATLADIGSRLAYPGRLSGASVTSKGPSGRVTEVTLAGDAGQKQVDGRTFASRLGLKSTLFELRADIGDAPPLPEPPATSLVAQAQGGTRSHALGAATEAVAVTPAHPARPRLQRYLPDLLALLLADLALMSFRARARARSEPGHGF